MRKRTGMAQHEPSDHAGTTKVWLTPPHILEALGGWQSFDLDPCAVAEPRPWPTAKRMIAPPDDGLAAEWHGRVWLNPPYGDEAGKWMARMERHGRGTALLFARTENWYWHKHIWPSASALHFFEGRLYFHRPDGSRGLENAGAPSVMIAYGAEDAEWLRTCGLKGHFLDLRKLRDAMAALPRTWRRAVAEAFDVLGGEARLPELYRVVGVRRPGATRFWREQVRKQVRVVGEQVERGVWRIRRAS